MSLKYAILGFIDMVPLSGYDLKKMFDASVNYYWPATHSQIYRTLDRMLQDGLVTQEVVHQEDHPDKKVYSIADRGRAELRDWLVTPAEKLPTIRHQLLVQLAWADRLENEQIVMLLDSYAEKLRTRLDLYHSEAQQSQLDRARSERERYLWQLILDNGIGLYERELEWAERAIAGLRGYADR